MRIGARRAMPAAMSLAVAVLALGLAACGGSKKKQQQDPVSMAMQTPGIRMLVIPEQRDDLKVAIPPCGQAQAAAQTSTQIPPGSNQIVVPRGALTQTVAVQPCTPPGQSSGGSSSGGSSGSSTPPPPPASTVLVTPGGASSAQQASSSGSSSGGGQQLNQVVLPERSEVKTVIVPPCVPAQSASSQEQGSGKSNVLRAEGNATVTAPACLVPQQSGS
jgi:uncharacterized membrane protein YgcG